MGSATNRNLIVLRVDAIKDIMMLIQIINDIDI